MKISELLKILEDIADKNKISKPYIVGGLPRDKEFGIIEYVKDIDITTGDNGIFSLAKYSSEMFPDANFRFYNDGHSSLDFKNIKVDFSNNYNLPNISELLKNPTELEKELFSRDFTINTLLQPVDLSKNILDITKMGLNDIKNRVLRTPVNPEFTIGYDARRILRAIKLILKFDLIPDKKLEETIIKLRGNISNLPLNHVKKQINQMLDINSKKTLELLIKYKLLPIIPLSRMMTLELAKNRMVQNLFD